MISELSEEQVALVGVYQKKWSDKFFSLEFDEQKANEFVDFLYSLLVHEEHNTLLIPKGVYKVVLQREVDLLGQVRQVMD